MIRFSDHIDRKGKDLFKLARNTESKAVAKHKQSLYMPGSKSKGWLKIKTGDVVQGVIAGFIIDQNKEGTGFNCYLNTSS